MLIPKIKVDAYISEQDINLESVRELQKLEPFGPGNPTPVFAYKGLKITDIRTVGQGKHLKLLLNIGNVFVDAIGFNMGHVAAAFSEGDLIDAAFSLEVNSWNNNEKIQLVLRDIRSGGKIALKNDYYYKLDKDIENSVPIKYNRSICLNNEVTSWDEIVPDRKDLEAVYISLKECPGRDIIIDNLFIFARKVSKTYGVSMNYFKLKRCIEIFEELELLDKVPLGKLGMYIALEDSSKKNNLENSKIYRQYQEIKNKLI
jgi:hypothetical protein